MSDRYVIQRRADQRYWSGDVDQESWAANPIAARWFTSRAQAEAAGEREVDADRSTWSVEPLTFKGEAA